MRDIGRRIQRYRLSRYAPPGQRAPRRLGWIGIAALAWLAWAGLFSDHSMWRIWQLERERAVAERTLTEARAEREQLEDDLTDPAAIRLRQEQAIRKDGYAAPDEFIYLERPGPPDSVGRR